MKRKKVDNIEYTMGLGRIVNLHRVVKIVQSSE